MNLIRVTLTIVAVLLLASCSSSDKSPSPTAPGIVTGSSVQVTSALVSLIASAQAGVGGPAQLDEQISTRDILGESNFSDEVSAGATSTGDGRSASAGASIAGAGTASWASAAELSSMTVDFVGGGEGATGGRSQARGRIRRPPERARAGHRIG